MGEGQITWPCLGDVSSETCLFQIMYCKFTHGTHLQHPGRAQGSQHQAGGSIKGRSCGAQSKEPGPESKTRIQLARKVPYEAHRNPTGAPKGGQKSQRQVVKTRNRLKLQHTAQNASTGIQNSPPACQGGPMQGPRAPTKCHRRSLFPTSVHAPREDNSPGEPIGSAEGAGG